MIIDHVTPAELDAALAAARRVERDRLARILHAHGLARIARDVECLDDAGVELDWCPDCDGDGVVESDWPSRVPCRACGGDGRHHGVAAP